ncbi:glycolipid transfer protein 3 [Silene latifolia]|uniref:glycolipid transfer protein 3 n=1 Tax=Silene latifolia TaxID=37657 RepID=UPI003D777AE3
MKRKRDEIIEKKTGLKSAIEELSVLVKLDNKIKIKGCSCSCSSSSTAVTTPVAATITNNGDGCFVKEVIVSNIPTRPFISICSTILHVLDKIGPTMAVLRQDICKNIQRLEMLNATNPTQYSYLVEILNKEAVEGNAKKGDTCSKALVWLTRSLNFTAALLQKLLIDPRENMEQIVGEAYEITFKPWHGWISAAAFRVALKLIPDTDTFISLLKAKDENLDTLKDDIETLISLLVPLLEDLHSILRSHGLDKLKST